MSLAMLISGGQTGVDRGALDAALTLDFPCGGWCPQGRIAEDGPIPLSYPVVELPGAGYRQRTIQNVIDSDGTLVLYFDRLQGGTEQTVLHCIRRQRPYKLIDAAELTPERAAVLVGQFVQENALAKLNVAGPRESSHEGARAYAFSAVSQFLYRLLSPISGQ